MNNRLQSRNPFVSGYDRRYPAHQMFNLKLKLEYDSTERVLIAIFVNGGSHSTSLRELYPPFDLTIENARVQSALHYLSPPYGMKIDRRVLRPAQSETIKIDVVNDFWFPGTGRYFATATYTNRRKIAQHVKSGNRKPSLRSNTIHFDVDSGTNWRLIDDQDNAG